MKDKNIGLIGLGNVGSKIANSLIIGGYNLFIYDLEKNKYQKLIKKGAIKSSSIKSICDSCTVIITCLPTVKSIIEVVNGKRGLSQYFNKKHLWIEMSTTDEKQMKKLSQIIEKKGADVLESPLTGGAHRCEKGNIGILVGGKKKVFNRSFPILSKIGYEIIHVGKIGNASTLKVVTNYLASTNLVSLGEALMICKKYGINLKKSYHAIRISSGNSFVHETESQVILNGSYNINFTMDLACKDVGLFNNLVKKYKVQAKLSPMLVKIFDEGIKKYGPRSWSTMVVKLLEDKSKTSLRSRGFPSILIDHKKRRNGIEIKII
tara:strand:+ start:410 stop:1369 length:960 start_codon:yes stop_codon:yes gene_type:complete